MQKEIKFGNGVVKPELFDLMVRKNRPIKQPNDEPVSRQGVEGIPISMEVYKKLEESRKISEQNPLD